MKESLPTIRNRDRALKYMPMGTCTLDSLVRIKNMVKAHFIGSVYPNKLYVPMASLLNNIMEIGGEDYQTVLENIKKTSVNFVKLR